VFSRGAAQKRNTNSNKNSNWNRPMKHSGTLKSLATVAPAIARTIAQTMARTMARSMARNMTRTITWTLAPVIVLGLAAVLPAEAQRNAAPVTIDGLQLVPDTQLGLVYADPEADLADYGKLLLMDAQVAFRKNWQRDINLNKPFNISARDMEQIKTDVAHLFNEIFVEELESAGFVLTDQQAGDTLIIRPAIVDLNVNSPDTPSSNTTRNITESAGDMTLYLELRDSMTGDLLVKALDFQFDRSNITPFMMDRTRNERAARRILSNWAEVLVNGLREAQVSTSGRL